MTAVDRVPGQTSHAELLDVLYNVPVAIVSVDDDGAIDLMNPAALQLLMPRAADGGMGDLYALLGAAGAELRRRVAEQPDTAVVLCDRETLSLASTDDELPTYVSASVVRLDTRRLLVSLLDVTERVVAERERVRQAQRLQTLFETVQDYAIVGIDRHGVLDEWNPSIGRLFGVGADAVGRLPLSAFLPDPDGTHPDAAAMLAAARSSGWVQVEGWKALPTGTRRWLETVVASVLDGDEIVGFSVVVRDATRRKLEADELVRLSITDSLTGLYNRRYAIDLLADLAAVAAGGGPTATVALVDLDHFKRINDTHGHDVGDDVLRAVARCMQQHVRAQDTVARIGGEEFLVVLSGLAPAAARARLDALRRAIADLRVCDARRRRVPITASVGFASTAGGGTDPHALLHRADQALYAAKDAGRDRVEGPADVASAA